jgi:hypothetical protein
MWIPVSPPMGRHSSTNLRRSLARINPYPGHDQNQQGRGSRSSTLRSSASGSSSLFSVATGSGSRSVISSHPQLEETSARTQPEVANWIPEDRPAARKISDLIKVAPGCYQLIKEARTLYLADIFCFRRCALDTHDRLFVAAKECLSTMASRRAQYMIVRRPEQPSCLPLEPSDIFFLFFAYGH